MSLPKLSKSEVQQIINNEKGSNLVVLDVRSREEQKQIEPLPTAVNVPVDEVGNAFEQLSNEDFYNKYHFQKPSKDSKVIVYCKMGMRAQSAGETLKKLGYDNVLHYSGVMDWHNNA